MLDGNCHVCDAPALRMVPGFDDLCRVTSDCKPWPRGGSLAVCDACGSVQKLVNKEWISQIEKIYENYSIYYQSDGVEQAVFDTGSSDSMPRSSRLLKELAAHVKLPETGRLLDVGCGNGALLRAFSQFAPRWTLTGLERSDKTREVVESIAGVDALYVGSPGQITGSYEMVTLIHMLEHIPRPLEYLSALRDRLKPGGLLVIEVPNYLQNPFDLLVADHCSHFTVRTATELIRKAGYQLLAAVTDWVPKELTIVAGRGAAEDRVATAAEDHPFPATAKTVRWLRKTAASVRQCARGGSFGIFGTSIAATWLFAEAGELVGFFVDEDPARIGKIFMGRRTYHPSEIPSGSRVFVGLPRRFAESVQSRISKAGVIFQLPPLLDV